jgi:hypothetical protein
MPIAPDQNREFRCVHCRGLIRIPAGLPPTTGPCPHCSGIITSPSLEDTVTHPPADNQDLTALVAEPERIGEDEPKIDDVDSREEDNEDADMLRRHSRLAIALGLVAIFFAVCVGGWLAIRELGNTPRTVLKDKGFKDNVALREAEYVRSGWKKDAYTVLGQFIEAKSVKDKIPHILSGESLAEELLEFYGDGKINDLDTPASSFAEFNLPKSDRERGLFLLTYDQPPQFSIKDFFRPLASLEVQYGLEEADMLLASVAQVSNFSMDPIRVHAFFRRTADGLRLDWETFAQTKYRKLPEYLHEPQIGRKKVFRVLIAEDVAEKRFSALKSRTYRIIDPVHFEDPARVVVPVDSDVARALATINWVGIEGRAPVTRTATVELEWRGEIDDPQLAISRFICWEFLGLGGRLENADPANPATGGR